MNSIPSIYRPLTLPNQLQTPGVKAEPSAPFKDFLANSIHEVNAMQQEADLAVEKLATGEDVNPAEVLTAVQKADVAFKLMMQIRNKLVQAYQEVQNVRV